MVTVSLKTRTTPGSQGRRPGSSYGTSLSRERLGEKVIGDLSVARHVGRVVPVLRGF
jgi:hypothetical protein